MARVERGADASQSWAEELGGNDGDDDLGIGDGRFVAGDGDGIRDVKAGEKEGVFAGVEDLLSEFRAVGPEGDLVATAAVKREGDGGSPCAGT
jgi:hypothetical protein